MRDESYLTDQIEDYRRSITRCAPVWIGSVRQEGRPIPAYCRSRNANGPVREHRARSTDERELADQQPTPRKGRGLMNTLALDAAMTQASSVTPTLSTEFILDAPLGVLLAEVGADIVNSSITDAAFVGAVVQRKSGRLYLAMPAGRSELEHDTMARYLIARVFDIDLPMLDAPFVMTEL